MASRRVIKHKIIISAAKIPFANGSISPENTD
jgi:hypothetical protein